MALSYRARVARAVQNGVPAEDVLRLVRPKQYLPVLRDVLDAYSPKAANDGLDFVKMMCRQPQCPVQPASRWKRTVAAGEASPHVSDRAAGALEEVVDAMGRIKAGCRNAEGIW